MSDYLPLAGGTMQGAINMNGNRITNVPNPANSGDAMNYRALVNAIEEMVDEFQSLAWSVTLSANDWVNLSQTIEDDRFVIGGYSYFVSASPSNAAIYGESGIYAEDIATNGEMTFVCTVVPTEDITVYIRRATTQ